MEILNDIACNLNRIEFNEYKFLNVIQIQLNWTQIYKLNSKQYFSPLKVNFYIEILSEFNLVELDSFHNLIKYNSTKL
jgi:beta-glucosidase/6-phospho-beta-glucosidase/beta-galactosidase